MISKMFPAELVRIFMAPERGSMMLSYCREFPDQQFKEEHAPVCLHIIGSMVDQKPVPFQEFPECNDTAFELRDDNLRECTGVLQR